MDWVFEGIGTALIVFLLGFFGAKARRRYKIRQVQKARNNATQVQSGRDTQIEGNE